MLASELAEVLRNGENSGVEFKRDAVHPDDLATAIAAMLNLEGGHILLGVEDDGTVSGLARPANEVAEWVANVCRNNVQPALIPFWETIEWAEDRKVGVITLPADSPDKPYKARRGRAWVTFVRIASTSREATREEEARLYQAAGLLRYDTRPVPGSSPADLDLRRIEGYFRHVRGQECPDPDDHAGWERLLLNTELLRTDRDQLACTVGAVLLFGKRPGRFLPQTGFTAAAYPGTEKDYAARERVEIRLPLVPLLDANGSVLESGAIDEAMYFVRRNTAVEAWIDASGRRQDRWRDYPLDAVREALVNAVAHRDYTLAGIDIELSIYADRLEVISPGRLPNRVTVEKMRLGYRATRNELLKEVLRDYRYVEATGLGVPRKIIRGMREHNGSEPDLLEEESRFTVRLWATRPA